MEFYDPKDETIFEDEGDLVATFETINDCDTRALYIDSIRADVKLFSNNDDTELIVADISPEKVFDLFRTKNIPVQSSKHNFEIPTTGSKVDTFFVKLSMLQSEVSSLKEELDHTHKISHSDSYTSPWSDLHNTAKDKLRQKKRTDLSIFQRKENFLNRIKSLQNNLLVVTGENIDKNNLKTVLNGSSSLAELLSKIESQIVLLDDISLSTIKDKIDLYKNTSDNLKLADYSTLNQLYSENKAFFDHIESKSCNFESISLSFPELVCRLKSLEIPHRNASNTITNFVQVERKIQKLCNDLTANKELLSAIKDGIDQNKAIISQNVARIRSKLGEALK
jgi:hypothetical protein